MVWLRSAASIGSINQRSRLRNRAALRGDPMWSSGKPARCPVLQSLRFAVEPRELPIHG